MKTIPMIFNTEMVKALLDGRKTVTRRPLDNRTSEFVRHMGSSDDECENIEFLGLDYAQWKDNGDKVRGPEYLVCCTEYPEEGCVPIGQGPARKGDLIWVRETFCYSINEDGSTIDSNGNPCLSRDSELFYRASPINGLDATWTPSIHMPRWASRLTLRVTDVRIEQVQDITEKEANKEGVAPSFIDEFGNCPVSPRYKNGFYKIWNSIYSNWNENPYVWVIEFEVIHKNVDEVE